MAVQKSKKTRSRRGMRRSHDSLKAQALSVDSTVIFRTDLSDENSIKVEIVYIVEDHVPSYLPYRSPSSRGHTYPPPTLDILGLRNSTTLCRRLLPPPLCIGVVVSTRRKHTHVS